MFARRFRIDVPEDERVFDVARWSKLPNGKHFPAEEAPEALAREIRAFFRPLRDRTA